MTRIDLQLDTGEVTFPRLVPGPSQRPGDQLSELATEDVPAFQAPTATSTLAFAARDCRSASVKSSASHTAVSALHP